MRDKVIIETSRLVLREFTLEDYDNIYIILSDADTMKHYPGPFDEESTKAYLMKNIERYDTFGFGLWAVMLKEENRFIGDCGVTMQNINGVIKPEIGYHINKHYQNKGYATEAAKACMDFIFENTTFNRVYSYMKYTNVASYTVAMHNGMTLVEEYDDPVNVISKAYSINREEWKARSRK